MPAKNLSTYRAYTATELKTRADIPSQVNIVVNGLSIDASFISTSAVKNLIGESSWHGPTICNSDLVNKWSAFGPYNRTLSGSGINATIVHNKPGLTKGIGSFAGYNHGAIVPSYISSINDTSSSAGGSITIECQFNLGELIITGGDIAGTSILGLVFTVWDGGTLMGHQVRSMASLKDWCDNPHSTAFSVSFQGPVSGTKSYQCKLYFVNVTDSASYSYNSSEVCQLFAELPQFTKTYRVPFNSYAVLSAPGGWSISGTPLTITLSNGYMSFQGLHNASFSGNLVVKGYVENELGVKLTEDTVFYLGGYSGDYGITGNALIWKNGGALGLPIPSTDRKAVLYVNPQ